jgi:hypothetical protein
MFRYVMVGLEMIWEPPSRRCAASDGLSHDGVPESARPNVSGITRISPGRVADCSIRRWADPTDARLRNEKRSAALTA